MSRLRDILSSEGLLPKRAVRRIVRPAKKWRPGQYVVVDGDAAGDYKGRVERREMVTKPPAGFPREEETQPGFVMTVYWHDGQWRGPREQYEIVAWDSEVTGSWDMSREPRDLW